MPLHPAFRSRLDATYALVVDDLNDGGEPACVGACTEESDTADLHLLPGACRDLGVAHLVGFGGRLALVLVSSPAVVFVS